MSTDDPATVGRLLLGFAAAGTVAAAAHRAGALTVSGACAATGVGAACVAAGWDWGALLVAFFVSSTVLSRVGYARKKILADAVVTKGGPRDATQVLANGGAFAACAVAYALQPSLLWDAAGDGALAAATADTWGTEVGMLAADTPRSILSWRPVPPGTSGGITPAGTLATIGGAIFIAMTARGFGAPQSVAWCALAGGVAGSTADSVLGATLQSRRWCSRCRMATERSVHTCGTPTDPSHGITWLNNDGVNVAGTAVGLLTAIAITWIAGRSAA